LSGLIIIMIMIIATIYQAFTMGNTLAKSHLCL
jgi:hypothetical protein